MSKTKITKRFAVVNVVTQIGDKAIVPLTTFKSKRKAKKEMKAVLTANPASELLLAVIPIFAVEPIKVKAPKADKVKKPSKLAIAAGVTSPAPRVTGKQAARQSVPA